MEAASEKLKLGNVLHAQSVLHGGVRRACARPSPRLCPSPPGPRPTCHPQNTAVFVLAACVRALRAARARLTPRGLPACLGACLAQMVGLADLAHVRRGQRDTHGGRATPHTPSSPRSSNRAGSVQPNALSRPGLVHVHGTCADG